MLAAARSSVLAIWMRLGPAVMERSRHHSPSALRWVRVLPVGDITGPRSGHWRRRPRAPTIGDVAGSYFGRRRHGGSAFGSLATRRVRVPSVRRFRVRILSVYNFSGSYLVHRWISGFGFCPFTNLGFGYRPSGTVFSLQMDEGRTQDRRMAEIRTQHALPGGLVHVDGQTANPGYADWARDTYGLRRWQQNEPGDGAVARFGCVRRNGPLIETMSLWDRSLAMAPLRGGALHRGQLPCKRAPVRMNPE